MFYYLFVMIDNVYILVKKKKGEGGVRFFGFDVFVIYWLGEIIKLIINWFSCRIY